jgi:hypothetical protein
LVASDSQAPDERAALRDGGYGSQLAEPMHHGAEVVGVVALYRRRERPWSRFRVGCACSPTRSAPRWTRPRVPRRRGPDTAR